MKNTGRSEIIIRDLDEFIFYLYNEILIHRGEDECRKRIEFLNKILSVADKLEPEENFEVSFVFMLYMGSLILNDIQKQYVKNSIHMAKEMLEYEPYAKPNRKEYLEYIEDILKNDLLKETLDNQSETINTSRIARRIKTEIIGLKPTAFAILMAFSAAENKVLPQMGILQAFGFKNENEIGKKRTLVNTKDKRVNRTGKYVGRDYEEALKIIVKLFPDHEESFREEIKEYQKLASK